MTSIEVFEFGTITYSMTKVLHGRIQRSADRCFQAFCDHARLPAWVPDLRRAKSARSGPDGLAAEVLFEFGRRGKTVTYSLMYAYDVPKRRVAWFPGEGARDAVRGFATFANVAGKTDECEMSYALEAGTGRPEAEADAQRVIDAFKRFMEAGPR